VAKGTQRESWKTTLGSQGTLTKNRHSDHLKRVNFSFLGDVKKRDVVIVADNNDDDEVRTSVSRNRVTVTLSTEELFLSIYAHPS
jgi:hypothetical protein